MDEQITPQPSGQQPTQPSGQPPVYPPVRGGDVPQAPATPASAPATQATAPAAVWSPYQAAPTAPAGTPTAPTGTPVAPTYAPSAPPFGSAFGQAQQPTAASPAVAAPRQRRSWPAVTAAALLAAVLASGGTALATGAFTDEASSANYGNLGSTTQVNLSSAGDVEWQAIAAQVRDSVVALSVTTPNGSGAGSGVVIDAENGYVVTNNHVVSGATTGGIAVTLADGRIIPATIVGTDPTTDIAVVQLAEVPEDLQASPWGDSSAVLVGQDVMAVGNPLGLASTVTTGIVSAVDRPVSTTGEDASGAVVTNAIQIDAAINPGNSGGPLFNTAGEVIGINSSIATTSSESGSIGLGFAIPANQAQSVARQLIADGVAEHAYLGVTLSDGTATADGVTRAGAGVESVSSGTPAAEAGLRAGDVVVGINARAVSGAQSLTGFVRQYAAGEEVTLTVVRAGEALDVNVTLAVRPDTTTQGGSGSDGGSGDSGDSGDQGQLPSLPQLPGIPSQPGGNG